MSWVIETAVAPRFAHAFDDQVVDHVGHDRVEAGGRLVEEDDLRLGGDRAGQRRRASACRPTARPGRSSPTSRPEPDRGQLLRARRPSRACALHAAPLDQPERDILPDRQRIEQGAPWNSMPNLRISALARARRRRATFRRRRSGSSRHRACSRPRMHLISHRFAGARAADDDEAFARRAIEIDAVEHELARRSDFCSPRTRDLGRGGRSVALIERRTPGSGNSRRAGSGSRPRPRHRSSPVPTPCGAAARMIAVIAAHQRDDEAEHGGLDQAGDDVVGSRYVQRVRRDRRPG